ncbi:hypothetical protein QUB05_22910, partial [Microcoleus sp. F10-C6]
FSLKVFGFQVFTTDKEIRPTSAECGLQRELDRKDLIILSALEKIKYGKIYTEIYGIVAGEDIEEMQHIEQNLYSKGLQQLG